MNGYLEKLIKSVAYASGGGVLAIGGANVDLINADLGTVLYMILSAVIFNVIKEFAKKHINPNDKK